MDALTQNARLHPGVGAYYEMRDYYNLLTEEEIRGNPDMICAMSMLRSMTFEPEESEKWYEALKEYIQRMDRRDSDYRDGRNGCVPPGTRPGAFDEGRGPRSAGRRSAMPPPDAGSGRWYSARTPAWRKSEKWYEALKEYIQRMDRRDSDYRRVLGLQSYLELGLPHRGTDGLTAAP